ncbi:MAG: hypothetical protein ACRDSR_09655 [Pseudonocardiaceae bacterium]
MAVFDRLWWDVWWPWMLVWAGTVAAIVATVVITILRRRSKRENTGPHKPGVPVYYLNEESIKDLHDLQGGKYQQEIEHKIISSLGAGVLADLGLGQARGNWGKTTEIVKRWVQDDRPITVIGSIIDVLEKADDIVYVDLRKGAVTANTALKKMLNNAGVRRRNAVLLSNADDKRMFVWVYGKFCVQQRTTASVTFQAPYGAAAAVHVSCDLGGLQPEAFKISEESFSACCLGHVESWDDSRLVLKPMAVFT